MPTYVPIAPDDPRIVGLLRTRARAIQFGDFNVANCCTVELGRFGYSDEPETTAIAPLPENTAARPKRKRTR